MSKCVDGQELSEGYTIDEYGKIKMKNILSLEEFGRISVICRDALQRRNPETGEELLLTLAFKLVNELVCVADNAVDELEL